MQPRTTTDLPSNCPAGEGRSCHVDVRTTDNGSLAFGVLTMECGDDRSGAAAHLVPFDQGEVSHTERVFDYECEEPGELADDLMGRLFFGDDNPPSQEDQGKLRDKLIDWIVENRNLARDAYYEEGGRNAG